MLLTLQNFGRGSVAYLRQSSGFRPALPQRIGKWKLDHLRRIARARRLQHCQGPPLFRQTLIDEPQFSLETEFQKAFVTFDVALMGSQTRNAFTHKYHSI